MIIRQALVVALLVWSPATAALAQPGMQVLSPTPATSTPAAATQAAATHKPSYRAQLMMVDAGALLLLQTGTLTDTDLVTNSGWAGYVVGAPLVHVSQGNYRRSLGSLALRLGLPLIGSIINSAHCRDILCEVIFATGGIGMGMTAAMILDWTLLGSAKAIQPAGPAMSPTVMLGRDGQVSVGVLGQW